MKRVLSLVLALTLVLGSIPAGFAADTQTAGEILKGYGVLSGDANGNLNETQTIDRATMYTVLIKLLGKDAEAKAYTVPSTFTDDNTNWAANYIAFAEKEGLTKGVGNGLFSPNGKVTLQQMATIMLRALGYEADYNTAIADATAQGILKSVVETENNGIVVKSDVYTSMLNTLSAPVKDSTELLGNVLKISGFTAVNAGPVAVSTIAPASAKTIKVTFASAVADTTKAVFTVKKGSTAVAVTTTWNEAKTEATLAAASNFAEATYSINVAYDTKDISSKEVAFTAQKIAKIEFVSATLAVTVGSNTGYATYKVYDQYNNDITNTAMANALTPQAGVTTTTLTIKNGLMTITPASTQLVSLQNLSVVIYDSGAGVTATKSLPISTVVGTLTDFQLGSGDAIKLVEDDTTSVFYIPYTAKDMSGNETKSYELISGGLIDADGGTAAGGTSAVDLVVSLSSYVKVKVVKDPSNSKNAAIEVRYEETGTPSALSMNMPLTITAMTYGGKSSTVNTTLTKAKAVDKVVLMAPEETVGANETPEIPFEAYDAAGNKLTSFTYINPTTITANGFTVVEKADGSAKFVMNSVSKGTVTLTASVTSTGKVSNLLTINVQETAHPAALGFVQSGIVQAMEQGATQTIEVGPDFVVYDQYDRKMSDSKIVANFDGTMNNDNKYYVQVTVTGDATVGGATSFILGNATDMALAAANVAGSSATIEFELLQDKATDVSLDTASTSISVVATADIESYTLAAPTAPIYAFRDSAVLSTVATTDQEKEFSYRAKVYGATKTGTKVLLKGTPVIATALSNTTDFRVTTDGSALAYNGAYLTAYELDNNRTAATTDLVVTVAHNNKVKALTVPVTSSTTAPVAKEIFIEGEDDNDGVVTLAAGTVNTNYSIQYYNPITGAETYSDFYFYIEDSYGTNGMSFAKFSIAKIWDDSASVYLTGAGASAIATVDNYGNLNITGAAADDIIYVTAVTNNGLSSTMKIVVE